MTLRQHWIVALLVFFGTAAILLTYPRLSLTADEWSHTECGLQWWQEGRITLQYMNPPLPRIIAATPVYFNLPELLYPSATPGQLYNFRNSLIRLTMLPLYVFACVLVFRWSRKLYGVQPAIWSLACFVTLPPMLAHSGFSNTDAPYTVMFLWALVASITWLEEPAVKRAAWMGISTGLMICSKFSGLVQLPAAMGLIMLAHTIGHVLSGNRTFPWKKQHMITLVFVAIPLIALVVGAVYQFRFDAFDRGVTELKTVNKEGFSFWFFGPLSAIGIWYFFPVLFLFKTPIPSQLALIFSGGISVSGLRRGDMQSVRRLYPLLAFAGVMLSSMASSINMGIRHVLPLYPLMAVAAGYAFHYAYTGHRRWLRPVAALLLAWQAAATVYYYPEYVSYYNELSGSKPERIYWDSDFDWGQGMRLLGEEVEKRNITELYACLRGLKVTREALELIVPAKTTFCNLNGEHTNPPFTGWIVVSRVYFLTRPWAYQWLEKYKPVASIGRTIELYYIPPEDGALPQTGVSGSSSVN